MTALPRATLVTGGGTGLGRAIAAALASAGREVVIAGRRREVVEATARELGARAIAADVTGDPGPILDAAGPVDGLVHAAGHRVEAPVGRWRGADWDALWAVHVRGGALLAQAFAQRCTGPGAILFVSSTLACRPAPGMAAYGAVKAAQLALVRTLALELAPRGIRANALLPGVVPTPMNAGRDPAALVPLHPLGRLGRPEEVAGAALALLRNPWITGAALAVDGGLLVRP